VAYAHAIEGMQENDVGLAAIIDQYFVQVLACYPAVITMASACGVLHKSTSLASKVSGTWNHFVCTTGPVRATWLTLQ
jgi:hypothetical protein